MTECPWFASPQLEGNKKIHEKLDTALKEIRHSVDLDRGGEFISYDTNIDHDKPDWFLDSRIEGVCNHTTRGHMVSDLYRYFYAACFAEIERQSPKLENFPPIFYLPTRTQNALQTGNLFLVIDFGCRLAIDLPLQLLHIYRKTGITISITIRRSAVALLSGRQQDFNLPGIIIFFAVHVHRNTFRLVMLCHLFWPARLRTSSTMVLKRKGVIS